MEHVYRGWHIVITGSQSAEHPYLTGKTVSRKLREELQELLKYEGGARADIPPKKPKIRIQLPRAGTHEILAAVACHELGHICDEMTGKSYIPTGKYDPPNAVWHHLLLERPERVACELGEEFFTLLFPDLRVLYDDFSRNTMRFKIDRWLSPNGKEIGTWTPRAAADYLRAHDTSYKNVAKQFNNLSPMREVNADSQEMRAILNFVLERIHAMIDEFKKAHA